jgi:hypothetical protein
MENKFDISVILPIKSSKVKDFDTYFEKSINSLRLQKVSLNEVIIVPTQEESLNTLLKSYDFGDLNVKIVPFVGEPNFASQVNFGVENATSKWISILEFDDEYATIWFDNVKKYDEIYQDEVDAYLPIVVDVDNKGVFAGFTNEATFAAGFTTEIGYLTNDMLHDYQNFQSSGMVMKREQFLDFGGIKPSMKLTFVYEFLLRMTYNSVKIMTIPKMGYKHENLREGSIFWNYKFGEDKIVDDEVKFWLNTAKKEYFFNQDRSIKYEPIS